MTVAGNYTQTGTGALTIEITPNVAAGAEWATASSVSVAV